MVVYVVVGGGPGFSSFGGAQTTLRGRAGMQSDRPLLVRRQRFGRSLPQPHRRGTIGVADVEGIGQLLHLAITGATTYAFLVKENRLPVDRQVPRVGIVQPRQIMFLIGVARDAD